MQLIEEITQMLNCLLNNKCQSCGYTLRGLLLASDVAILQNAHPCVATHSCVVQVSMITRWKILYASGHFSGIHFTSAQKKKHFEMKPIWNKTRNRTSDGFTNLILTGGLTGATRYSSLSPLADQYQESGHYAPLKALRAQSICYYFSSAGCI